MRDLNSPEFREAFSVRQRLPPDAVPTHLPALNSLCHDDGGQQGFGKGWFEGGKLDIKFTNIVWPDDHVITKGVITDRVDENGGMRANVAVWVEKQDGTVCVVGTASALE